MLKDGRTVYIVRGLGGQLSSLLGGVQTAVVVYYRPGGQVSSLLGAVQTFVIVARGCADSHHGNFGLYEQSARDKSSLAVM